MFYFFLLFVKETATDHPKRAPLCDRRNIRLPPVAFKTLGRVDSFHYATSDEICEFVNVPLN